MMNIYTLAERNTYSSAHALTLPVAVFAVNGLAAAGGNRVLVLVVAAVGGLCLAAWSRLLYSLTDTVNRWIGPLIGLTTVGLLLAALARSWPTTVGVAVLLFVGWLPFMAAESAGQELRERACWSQKPHVWRLARWAQTVIDLAAIGATAVFLAASVDGQLPPLRLAATLILIAPLLLSRAADRSGPMPDGLSLGDGWTLLPLPSPDEAQQR